MTNPFDYINTINFSKTDIMSGTDDDQRAEAGYVPFITNRTLSYFPDTIMHANLMNNRNHIDNKLQYSYLINSIRPRKRFTKWAKKMEDNDLEAVKQYYNYNDVKAESAMALLSPDQLIIIKQRLNEGGRQ
jgi:hypothetical protein